MPGVGPIVFGASGSGGANLLQIVWGVAEAGSIALIVGGCFTRTRWLVPGDLRRARTNRPRLAWTLGPGPAAASLGVSAMLAW